jgi:hypothetical protein
MNDFVVAGRKNDVLAFTLVPAFFSLENNLTHIIACFRQFATMRGEISDGFLFSPNAAGL